MTASYSTSSSGASVAPGLHHTQHHQASHQATPRYSTEANGYVLDPVQEYARILYEHTRRQLDNASSAQAASQQGHRESRQAHRSHRGREGRTAALA